MEGASERISARDLRLTTGTAEGIPGSDARSGVMNRIDKPAAAGLFCGEQLGQCERPAGGGTTTDRGRSPAPPPVALTNSIRPP